MTPPALAEKAESVADSVASLRSHLSAREQNRFDVEFFDATHHGDREALRSLFLGWTLTVYMREQPTYQEQVDGFMRLVGSGDPFGDNPALAL